MTDKPTPTDAEILDAAEDFRSQYTHGGTTFDEFDEIGFARAVLAKWGTPATGGGPAGTVGYTVHGTQYVNWRTKPPAHGTPIYTTLQPTQAQAGAVPLTPERVKEIVRGAGYDQCGIPDTERAAFINGLRHGEHAHGIKGGQHGTE